MFKYVYNLLTVICLLLFSSVTALSAAPYYITTDNLKYAGIDLDWRQIPTFTTMDTVYLYSQPDKNSQIYYHVPPNEQLQLEDTRAYLYLYDSNIKMPENPPSSYLISTNMPKKGDSVNLIYNNPQDDISIVYYNGYFMTFPALQNKFQRNAEIWLYLQNDKFSGWAQLNENNLRPLLTANFNDTINPHTRFYEKYFSDSDVWYWIYSGSYNTFELNKEHISYNSQNDTAEIYIQNTPYSSRQIIYSHYIISFKNNTMTKTDYVISTQISYRDIFSNHPEKEDLDKYFDKTSTTTFTPEPNSIDAKIMETTAEIVDRNGKLKALSLRQNN